MRKGKRQGQRERVTEVSVLGPRGLFRNSLVSCVEEEEKVSFIFTACFYYLLRVNEN